MSFLPNGRICNALTTRLLSRRVFILGPSHHVYLDGCSLSRCREYQTPLGPLPIDSDSTSQSGYVVTLLCNLLYGQQMLSLDKVACSKRWICRQMKTNIASRCIYLMFAKFSKGATNFMIPTFLLTIGLCFSQDIVVVPILVGAIDKEKEETYGRVLAPFLAREDTFCVVSSDFCHWCVRFMEVAILNLT